MDNMFGVLQKTSKWLAVIAGTALTLMMLLTVSDVVGRAFGHPIMGTYEVVGLMLALVIGFAMPKVSLARQHIYMDFYGQAFQEKQGAHEHLYPDIVHHSLCPHRIQLSSASAMNFGPRGKRPRPSGCRFTRWPTA